MVISWSCDVTSDNPSHYYSISITSCFYWGCFYNSLVTILKLDKHENHNLDHFYYVSSLIWVTSLSEKISKDS